ncbi:hypothetical protein [Providencia huashanensis]|uniref:hypothetical protein n=1 Tax=Providencia huashanensis TaxID=3037798 RepID=UPI0040454915
MSDIDKDYLHRQLVKLGDMIGDGLHHEPDGKWITKEYRRICKALGYIKPTPRKPAVNNSSEINEKMAERLSNVNCKCGSKLKQSRSGSMKAICTSCNAKYTLLKRVKVKSGG